MTSFWCSNCKTKHAGECAVTINNKIATLHEWEQKPIVALAKEYQCKKCLHLYVIPMVSLMSSNVYPNHEPSPLGCPAI